MGRPTNRIRPPAASTRLISSLRVTAERIRVVQVAPADSGAPPQARALSTSLTGPSRKPEEHATTSGSTTHRSTIRKIRPDQLERPALPLRYSDTRHARPPPIARAAYKHANARQAAPRRTLSLTIASQTIASSPDGSETSSTASSACCTPAATVGSGWRFRASSTVTSSSSPCNNTLGHSAAHARSTRVPRVPRWRCTTRVRREYPWSRP
jgi:hypothetical protein